MISQKSWDGEKEEYHLVYAANIYKDQKDSCVGDDDVRRKMENYIHD